jgi:integrase
LVEAQTWAKRHFEDISRGGNPAAAKREEAAKAASKQTIGKIAPLFLAAQEAKGRTPNYLDENRRSLFRVNKKGEQDAYFSEMHQHAPDDVTRRMVATELNEIAADHGPIAMSRCRAHLHKFWNWAIAQGFVEGGNPVAGTEKFNPTTRDRQHSEAELRTIWAASDDANDYDVIQKLIALTAARRNQIGQLKRSEVKRNEMKIELSGPGRSKNGTTFLLPLSQQALALINKVWDRRQDDTGYLFGEGGDGGFSGWSNAAIAFKKRLGDDFRDYWLHDFRRTFQNVDQDKLKIALHITDACMNHIAGEATAGSRKHYNFAQYWDEKQAAMQVWGDYIECIVTAQQSQLDERTAA